ncbi:MAG: squalene/phytoene synthase family protein [Rhodobacteraceae bacterium]|nr:squalene/phytoene synthase family protein [Paracoccaceae bacterium]MCP5340768.1 squalene/phytoene synthase family protein [Paracoccaceae bacterium]
MNATACAPLVEAGDPDRFLTVMAAPMPLRPRLWPLYAYNLEIARAPWASSEPMVAEMRLQWWIDTVEAMGRGTLRPGHEVTDGLAPLIAATEGLAPLLVRMAEARRWEVWRDPFADAAALGAHLDETAGTLMWAAARLLDAPRSAEEPVRAFGAAAGLAAWFRAVPALTALGRQPLPDTSPAAIGRLARNALDRIAAARRDRHLVPAFAHPALWPGWQARRTLAMALADPSRVANGTLGPGELSRRASLVWTVLRGTW